MLVASSDDAADESSVASPFPDFRSDLSYQPKCNNLMSACLAYVTVDGFWIDRYAVTNADFGEFVGRHGHCPRTRAISSGRCVAQGLVRLVGNGLLALCSAVPDDGSIMEGNRAADFARSHRARSKMDPSRRSPRCRPDTAQATDP